MHNADRVSGKAQNYRGFMAGVAILQVLSVAPVLADTPTFADTVERWGVQEIAIRSAREYPNPFTDPAFSCRFQSGSRNVTSAGFYDGNHTWKCRLMPEVEGPWTFTTYSNDPELNGKTGTFQATRPGAGNHGPISVRDTFHFAYADGTPFQPVGTTMYNWLNRDPALELKTLSALSRSPFNKVRFGPMPKWYTFNQVDPPIFPYARKPDGSFDFTRFEPAFFNHYEARIRDLEALGIEADIILFHPYDRWGFANMSPAEDDTYIRYIAARFSAFRNIWWCLANEYDLFHASRDPNSPRILTAKDWNHLGELVRQSDPYRHLLGIHNARAVYDYSEPWITHVIYQYHDADIYDVTAKLRRYKKPVVVDEYGYEGANGTGFGSLSGMEEIEAQWNVTMAGAYGSHGDCYVHPGDILWWAVGGDLDGDSPPRYGFLRRLMEEAPFAEMQPLPELVHGVSAQLLGKRGAYYLIHTPRVPRPSAPTAAVLQSQPAAARGGTSGSPNVEIDLDSGLYRVDMIDSWNMRIYPLGYTQGGEPQSYRPKISPGLMRFVRVEKTDGKLPTGSITELLTSFAALR
jgi:hypothetical protein